MAKRSRRSIPIMLFWSKRDQARFIESIERFTSLVNDLETIVLPAKNKKLARTQPPNGKVVANG